MNGFSIEWDAETQKRTTNGMPVGFGTAARFSSWCYNEVCSIQNCRLLYTMGRHHSQSSEESIPAYILFMKACLFDFNNSKALRKILVELVTQRPS